MEKKKIQVFGAGLVGSMVSLMLAQQGHLIRLIERRPDPRKKGYIGGRSINLALSDRGWRALERVGLVDKAKEMALPMTGRMTHDKQGKQTFIPYGQQGQAIYSISRAGLNMMMIEELEKLDNTSILFDHRLSQLDLNTNKAEVVYGPTGNTLTFEEASYSIAADGAFSAARLNMQMQQGFNYSQEYLPYGYKELTIPPTSSGEFALDPEALHIWPRDSFMLIALPNPDKSFTCTLFLAYDSNPGFDQLRDAHELMKFFEAEFADTIPLIPELEKEFFENPTGSLVTIRCYPWNMGKSLLLGDASHAIVPFYGQGMNSGFEDCSILMEHLDHTTNWDTAFKEFQEVRKKDADAIADLALDNFIEMRQRVADPKFQLQKKIERALSENFPDRWKTRYSLVSFSTQPYSHALSTGELHDRFFEAKILPQADASKYAKDISKMEELLNSYDQWLEAYQKGASLKIA